MKQNLIRLGSSYADSKATRAWKVGLVDPLLRWTDDATPTSDPAAIEQWRPTATSRLALSTDRSRLVSIQFDSKDNRSRLEEKLGFALAPNAPTMSDETVILRLPPALIEVPTCSPLIPGVYLSSAHSPLLIPEADRPAWLAWLQDARGIEHLPVAPSALLALVDRRAWTTDRIKNLGF